MGGYRKKKKKKKKKKKNPWRPIGTKEPRPRT
jgi:hypothetical protein